jgi:hypothetical protein
MVLDILYEILSDGKDLEKQIKVLRNVINIYNQMKEGGQSPTQVQKMEKND